MERSPKLYTQETIVFSQGVAHADITRPVTVYTDALGNHALSDGNHRAVRAHSEGKLDSLPRNIIGHVNRDISADPDYKPIRDVRIIEKTVNDSLPPPSVH